MRGSTCQQSGEWYKDADTFISKYLFGSEPGDALKLLISGSEVMLRHSITMKDGSDHDYELQIRRSTLRFNERMSNSTRTSTRHSGYCVSFARGVQQKGNHSLSIISR